MITEQNLAIAGTDASPNSSTPVLGRTFRLRRESDENVNSGFFLSAIGGSPVVTVWMNLVYGTGLNRWIALKNATALTVTVDAMTPVAGAPYDVDLFVQVTAVNSATNLFSATADGLGA